MADTYIMFKTLRIQNIGGTMPQGIHILGTTGEWYWGKLKEGENESILWDMREFFPMIINEEISKGLGLLNVTQIEIDLTDMNSDLRDLNSDELECKAKAEKTIQKLKVRALIEENVGDVYDIIADLSKKIALMETLMMKTFNVIYNTDVVSQSLKTEYRAFISNYMTDVESGIIINRVDLDDDIDVITKKLNEKNKKIHDIVKEEYNL